MPIINSCLERQNELFNKLLDEASESWPPRGYSLSDASRECFTLVIRPIVLPVLAETIESLSKQFPEHIYYGPENIHLTVLGLPKLEPGSSLYRYFDRFMVSHIPALKSFKLPVQGLSIVGSTVIAKCFDQDGSLLRFVAASFAELGEGIADLDEIIGLHRSIYWLSIARLTENAQPELLETIKRDNNREFGTISFNKMELVRTDRLFRPEATKVLNTYEFGLL